MDSEIPECLLDELAVEEIVKSLCFKKNAYGCYEGKIHILNITACYEGIGSAWRLIISFATDRSQGMRDVLVAPHDLLIPGEIAPIELFLIFYKHWKYARGGDLNDTLLPLELYYGKIYFENKKILQKIIPSAPTLHADRAFFRFCINHLDKNVDRSTADYDIEFSKFENQLQLKAKDLTLYCPAHGDWLGTMVVSASDFFDFLPKRFLSDTVRIEEKPGYILINSYRIKARHFESIPQN